MLLLKKKNLFKFQIIDDMLLVILFHRLGSPFLSYSGKRYIYTYLKGLGKKLQN